MLLRKSIFFYQIKFCSVDRIHFKKMMFCKCMIILCFWCPYRHYFVRVLLFNHYFHLCCYETYCKTYAVNEYSYSHLVLLFNSLFLYQVLFCAVNKIHFLLMLCWSFFILCVWCLYSHYFDRVLLMNYNFHLCCYDTYV